jgi:tRNA nucleotidyltransferase (CCA-adding enzyme)
MNVPPPVLEILRQLEAAGHETWCVGGAVRDALLGNPQQDVDLATAALPAEVRRLFRRTVPVGIEHGTVGVLDDDGVLHEVTTVRRDVTTDGRHAVVAFGVSLDDDLARRDFTINAIAYHPLHEAFKDPFNGRGDLALRLIRAVGNPVDRFREDRLRIFRALRFAARFDFVIDPGTFAAAQSEAVATHHLSAERVRDEWVKGIATAAEPATLAGLWEDAGVASVWLDADDVLPLRRLPRDPVLALAASRRPVEPILRRLRMSGADIMRGRLIDRGPATPLTAASRHVRRWLAEVGTAADDLMQLAVLAGAGNDWRAEVSATRSRGDATSRSALALTGDDLVQAGLATPGPDLGRLLAALLDHVLDHPEANNRAALLHLAETCGRTDD